MAANEQYIQVAPNSTGLKVRNVEVAAVQQDGSVAVVEQQVVAIAREDGRLADLDGRWDELIALVRRTNRLLARGFDLEPEDIDIDPDQDT